MGRCAWISVFGLLLATGCAGPRGIGLGPQARGGGAAGPAASFPGDPWAPRAGSVGAVGPAAWRNEAPDAFSRGVGYGRQSANTRLANRSEDDAVARASATKVEGSERDGQVEEEISTLPVALNIQLPRDDSSDIPATAVASKPTPTRRPAAPERAATAQDTAAAKTANSPRQGAAGAQRVLPMTPWATRWSRQSDPDTQRVQAVVADPRPRASRPSRIEPQTSAEESAPETLGRMPRRDRVNSEQPISESLPEALEPAPEAGPPAHSARSSDDSPATIADEGAPSVFAEPPALPAAVLGAAAAPPDAPAARSRFRVPASRSARPARTAAATAPSVGASQRKPSALSPMARHIEPSEAPATPSELPAPACDPEPPMPEPSASTARIPVPAVEATNAALDSFSPPIGSRLASIVSTPPAEATPAEPAAPVAPASAPEHALSAPDSASAGTVSMSAEAAPSGASSHPLIAPPPPPPFAPTVEPVAAPMGRPRLGWTHDSATPTILPQNSASSLFPASYGPPMPSPTLPRANATASAPASPPPAGGRTIRLEVTSPEELNAPPPIAPQPRRSWRPKLLSRWLSAADNSASSR